MVVGETNHPRLLCEKGRLPTIRRLRMSLSVDAQGNKKRSSVVGIQIIARSFIYTGLTSWSLYRSFFYFVTRRCRGTPMQQRPPSHEGVRLRVTAQQQQMKYPGIRKEEKVRGFSD